MTFFVLTPTEADAVRGLTVNGHAIAPRPFVASGASRPVMDGNFAVPEEVILDDYHLARRAAMIGLPTVPAALDTDWLTTDLTIPSRTLTFLQQCTFSPSWPVGQTIAVSRIGV